MDRRRCVENTRGPGLNAIGAFFPFSYFRIYRPRRFFVFVSDESANTPAVWKPSQTVTADDVDGRGIAMKQSFQYDGTAAVRRYVPHTSNLNQRKFDVLIKKTGFQEENRPTRHAYLRPPRK